MTLGTDAGLQTAIRRKLAGGGRAAHGVARRNRRDVPAEALSSLSVNRRQLLDLYYCGNITAESFKAEEDRLCAAIEAARALANHSDSEAKVQSDLEHRFEKVASILSNLDVQAVWDAAEDRERRVLVEELVEWVTVFPDHLEVTVAGAPALNVCLDEVGLKGSEIVSVGDPTQQVCYLALAPSEIGRKRRSPVRYDDDAR